MTALELMAACRRDNQEKARLEAQIEELDDYITCVAAFGGAGGSGSVSDRYADYMARKDELEKRLHETKKALAAESAAVILLTESLPDTQRKSMRGFYVYGKTAAAVARELHYSASSIAKALAAARAVCALISGDAVEDKLPPWYLKKYGEGAGKEWDS